LLLSRGLEISSAIERELDAERVLHAELERERSTS